MLKRQHFFIALTRLIVLMVFFFSVIGCAQNQSQQTTVMDMNQVTRQSVADGKSWWYYRIKVNWPKDTPPNWAMGTLVAGEVFAPILERYRGEIELWRFHRRAGRDKAGHLFSFIIYSHAEAAQSIISDLENNQLLLELLEQGAIDAIQFDDVSQLSRPNREDTSDKSWPMIIQKSWPDYIMGVSQMWLNLVESLALNRQDTNVLERYDDVHAELTKLWIDNGQHAWLHHLNALYAYQPFLIRY